jgi:hypothetical protein
MSAVYFVIYMFITQDCMIVTEHEVLKEVQIIRCVCSAAAVCGQLQLSHLCDRILYIEAQGAHSTALLLLYSLLSATR